MAESASPTVTRASAKVLNRAELTRDLVAKLKHDEAIVAGLGTSRGGDLEN